MNTMHCHSLVRQNYILVTASASCMVGLHALEHDLVVVQQLVAPDLILGIPTCEDHAVSISGMAQLMCGTCFSQSLGLMYVGLYALEHWLFVVQQLVAPILSGRIPPARNALYCFHAQCNCCAAEVRAVGCVTVLHVVGHALARCKLAVVL